MALDIEELPIAGYEKVFCFNDKQSGLHAIISIHNTTMGPTVGGVRFFPYNSFEEGLEDVLRLSKSMTYKTALVGGKFGGGKSVVFWDPNKPKPRSLLFSLGDAINHMEGRYYAAEDCGCTPEDLLIVRKRTRYVAGLDHEKSSGHPAPFTAWGTFKGIQTIVSLLGERGEDLRGLIFAVQGLGMVGMELCKHLFWSGAKLMVTDICPEKIQEATKRFGAIPIKPETIYDVKCDVFVPCAMGGIINQSTISRLRCRAIAGCANTQLESVDAADELRRRGILYAPDLIINSGGLINVTDEMQDGGYNPIRARNNVNDIPNRLKMIFQIAEQKQCSTHQAAMDLAAQHLDPCPKEKLQPAYYP